MGEGILKTGFVQFEPIFGDVEENLKKAGSLINGMKADVIVLPELFNTGYLFTSLEEVERLSEKIPDGKTTEFLCGLASRNSCFIVGGLAEWDNGRFFNSAVLVSPTGYVGTYRKIHLFSEEKLWFQPGDKEPGIFDLGCCRIGIMICFDWFFPETMRILSLKGADLICHCANLVLPFCQDGMRTRCLENHVYAVTANRTGQDDRNGKTLRFTGRSQITGPTADVLYSADPVADEVAVVEIDISLARDKNLNPYNHLYRDRRVEFYRGLCKDE
ncbi:Predicted amidohydrolase [Syntrophus gentianae]|uniref:Predicted amidohydrolase n=1 Tax=Syntrophus gentianae TaxID=43775 RepID=A0A1H7Z687_9BACT|nr:nitrilase-related carbon-nitrogen hydrolase [Syntrophus gentianae]SEM53524.1 Predicted amidohydrolase [Syntrophus gentianae]